VNSGIVTVNTEGLTEADYTRALEITPHFYRAALNPSVWTSVLSEFADAFNVPVAQFNLVDVPTITVVSAAQFGLSEEALRAWLAIEDFEAADPRVDMARHRPNQPFTELDVMTQEQWHAAPIYQNVFSRFGFESSLAVHTILEDANVAAVLGITRRCDAPAFDATDTARFHLYLPHFRQAVRVASRLYRTEVRNRSYEALFDRLRIGALVTDRFGELAYANASARASIEADEGIALSHGKLVAERPEETRDLHAAIFEAAVDGPDPETRRHLIRLKRHGSPTDLLLTITPLHTGEPEIPLGHDLHAAVFICDPDQVYEGDIEAMQRLFGLTDAEARVMQIAGSGTPTREIAATLGKSYETVRTHLKSVYRKTGVASQAELSRLVQSLQLPRLP
jgi:DNA-binding CsgD family transcriptional regulator/PAS domain-containing protein